MDLIAARLKGVWEGFPDGHTGCNCKFNRALFGRIAECLPHFHFLSQPHRGFFGNPNLTEVMPGLKSMFTPRGYGPDRTGYDYLLGRPRMRF